MLAIANFANAGVIVNAGDYHTIPNEELESFTAGAPVVAFSATPFTVSDGIGGNALIGTFTTVVVKLSNNNLVFTYDINLNSASQNAISLVRFNDFDNVTVEAGQDVINSSNFSRPFSVVSRSQNSGVLFTEFLPTTNGGQGFLNPGERSEILWFSTNATQFRPSTATIEGQQIATFAPVPEPATLTLLGLGAAALIKRRRKA